MHIASNDNCDSCGPAENVLDENVRENCKSVSFNQNQFKNSKRFSKDIGARNGEAPKLSEENGKSARKNRSVRMCERYNTNS